MSGQSFTTTFTVDQSPAEVMAGIANVRGWWGAGIEGASAKLGDEFTYRYEDLHQSTQRLVELVPDKKIVWLVTDAYLSFAKDKHEWQGTRLVFEIARKNDRTEVRFTHEGLVPTFECFGACSNAWGGYVGGSLKSLIASGRGQPNAPAKSAQAAAFR